MVRMTNRLAYTVSFVADGVKTLNDKFATRYPDDEDYHVNLYLRLKFTAL